MFRILSISLPPSEATSLGGKEIRQNVRQIFKKKIFFSEISRNFLPDLSDGFLKLRCAILTCAPFLGVHTLNIINVLL